MTTFGINITELRNANLSREARAGELSRLALSRVENVTDVDAQANMTLKAVAIETGLSRIAATMDSGLIKAETQAALIAERTEATLVVTAAKAAAKGAVTPEAEQTAKAALDRNEATVNQSK